MTLAALKPNSRAILRAIAQHPANEPARLTIREISETTHLSHITVRRHIRYLTKTGYLLSTRPGTGRPFVYTVTTATRLELMRHRE